MANRFKGETTVEVAGKVWRLVLDFNALCHFEGASGKNAMEVMQAFEGGKHSSTDLRHLMCAMLARHHPEATVEDAGDLLSEGLDVVGQALAAAMPAPGDDPEAAAKPGKPRLAGRSAR